jgi:hypothetical protein
LGCGDLRKTFHAITTKHPQHIHLNDALPSILARNIMVLKIVSANDFNPDDTDLSGMCGITRIGRKSHRKDFYQL